MPSVMISSVLCRRMLVRAELRHSRLLSGVIALTCHKTPFSFSAQPEGKKNPML